MPVLGASVVLLPDILNNSSAFPGILTWNGGGEVSKGLHSLHSIRKWLCSCIINFLTKFCLQKSQTVVNALSLETTIFLTVWMKLLNHITSAERNASNNFSYIILCCLLICFLSRLTALHVRSCRLTLTLTMNSLQSSCRVCWTANFCLLMLRLVALPLCLALKHSINQAGLARTAWSCWW